MPVLRMLKERKSDYIKANGGKEVRLFEKYPGGQYD
jgi:hypothetical protein